jgi:hypothetical protein
VQFLTIADRRLPIAGQGLLGPPGG